MKCPECGAPASDEDLFCGECGTILADFRPEAPADSSPAEAPYPPAPSAPTVPDTRARVAFILGIVSVGSALLSCLPFFGLIACVGPAVGLLAVVLGSIAKRDIRARGGREEDWKRAHQGVILGIVGMVLTFVALAFGVVLGLGIGWLGEW